MTSKRREIEMPDGGRTLINAEILAAQGRLISKYELILVDG